MESSGLWKPVLSGLLLALAIYISGFKLDQHLRTRHGPWQVEFTTGADGEPVLLVNQPKLHIASLKIVFAGERATNAPGSVIFDFPQKPVPFGRVKFEDLTYLPGTVTFDLFGHEIELIPRTLYINRKPHPWQSNTTITLSVADKPATLPEPDLKKRTSHPALNRPSSVHQKSLAPFSELVQVAGPKPLDLCQGVARLYPRDRWLVLKQALHFFQRELMGVEPLQRQRQRDADIHRVQCLAVGDRQVSAAAWPVLEQACRWGESDRDETNARQTGAVHFRSQLHVLNVGRADD